jgi:hypothetical protein
MASDDAVEGEIIEGPTSENLLVAVLNQQSVIFSIFLLNSPWEIIVTFDQPSSGQPEQ